MTAARLELNAVKRLHRNGDTMIAALAGVDLVIEAGEMVAIVGASGSGKSTLMNILGCLDRADSGTYTVAGVDVARLDADGLARLRREHFGFVFQQYHLIGTVSALENVELPGIYAGMAREARRKRARELMTRLGLEDRLSSRPTELSGGQQQRVAIARALMNGGGIILADEPTGALDSRSSEAVLLLLKELHRAGHTIVIVTHDRNVAAHADRIIEIADGTIVADHHPAALGSINAAVASLPPPSASPAVLSSVVNALKMSFRAMMAQKVRTALTMIGIVIGVTSVVAVVALGKGARVQVLAQMSEFGANTLSIYAGSGFNGPAATTSLSKADAEVLASQSYIESAAPQIISNGKARNSARTVDVEISGVGDAFLSITGLKPQSGRVLLRSDVVEARPNVVLSDQAATALYGQVNPLGQTVLVERVPATVVGVLAPRSTGDRSLSLYMSYTSLRERIAGNAPLARVVLRVKESFDAAAAERTIRSLMIRRHGAQDFFIVNQDQLRRSIARTTATFSLLIAALAAVALVVGGIGVMNIMLISVTERTREIGLRMAVGARRSDILMQFMIEALAVCLAGGAFGTVAAFAITTGANEVGLPLPIIFDWGAIVLACGSTILTGLVFGYLPARNAARLDPAKALARE